MRFSAGDSEGLFFRCQRIAMNVAARIATMGAMPMKLLECDAAVMIVGLLLSCPDQHYTEPENCKPAC